MLARYVKFSIFKQWKELDKTRILESFINCKNATGGFVLAHDSRQRSGSMHSIYERPSTPSLGNSSLSYSLKASPEDKKSSQLLLSSLDGNAEPATGGYSLMHLLLLSSVTFIVGYWLGTLN